MENLSSQEFISQLKTNNFKQGSSIKGIVKKSDSDSEILFARKGNFGNWIKIPASMIESVSVIKTFKKEEENFTVVKLNLKTPTTPEGKVLFDLLASHEDEEGHEGMFGMKHKLAQHFGACPICGHHHGMGNFAGHHCGCSCHKHEHENFFSKYGKFFGHHAD